MMNDDAKTHNGTTERRRVLISYDFDDKPIYGVECADVPGLYIAERPMRFPEIPAWVKEQQAMNRPSAFMRWLLRRYATQE